MKTYTHRKQGGEQEKGNRDMQDGGKALGVGFLLSCFLVGPNMTGCSLETSSCVYPWIFSFCPGRWVAATAATPGLGLL